LEKGFLKPEDLEPKVDGLEFYYDAFGELGTARQFGMAVGPIPFTAIAEYFRIYDIEGDFHEFSAIIRRMDSVYLELNAEEMKKPPPKQDKEKPKSGIDNKKNPN